MSRVGKLPVQVPKGATVQVRNGAVAVKGPKGEMSVTIPPDITVAQEGERLLVKRSGETDAIKSRHGLAQRLLQNACVGVSQGFTRVLEIVGVGYRAAKQGDKLVVTIGYTKPVEIAVPKGVEVSVEANTKVVLKGVDKRQLGQMASDIRAIRPPEVYQGKGIRYMGERVRKKAGKAAGAGAGAAAGGGGK